LLFDADGVSLFQRFDVEYASMSIRSRHDTVAKRGARRALFVSPFPDDLPEARTELLSLQTGGLDVDSLTSEECSRSRVFGKLTDRQYDVVHFACHAMVNYERPALSFLEFSKHERCYVSDLLRSCECPNAVVVLSACDSSVASLNRVDLKNSLADAFYLTGASAVVGSLWPLEDAAVGGFMARLYAGVAAGLSVEKSFHATFREVGTAMSAQNWPCRYWGALTLGVPGHHVVRRTPA